MYLYRIHAVTFLPFRAYNTDNQLIIDTTIGIMFQSTHPRRVRLNQLAKDQSEIEFQSTHPRRVRPFSIYQSSVLSKFQSTHPRRVRRHVECGALPAACFNPRTHVGCDCMNRKTNRRKEVSIHAPT